MKVDKLEQQVRDLERKERQTVLSTDRLKLASDKQVLRKDSRAKP